MRIFALASLTVTTVVGMLAGALAAFISSATLQDEGLTARSLFVISVASVIPLILTAALVVSHSEGNKDKVKRQRVLLVLSWFAGVVCAVGASVTIRAFVESSTANTFWVGLWNTVAVIISVLAALMTFRLVRLGVHYLLYRFESKRKAPESHQVNPEWVQKLDFDAWEQEFKNEQHKDS